MVVKLYIMFKNRFMYLLFFFLNLLWYIFHYFNSFMCLYNEFVNFPTVHSSLSFSLVHWNFPSLTALILSHLLFDCCPLSSIRVTRLSMDGLFSGLRETFLWQLKKMSLLSPTTIFCQQFLVG